METNYEQMWKDSMQINTHSIKFLRSDDQLSIKYNKQLYQHNQLKNFIILKGNFISWRIKFKLYFKVKCLTKLIVSIKTVMPNIKRIEPYIKSKTSFLRKGINVY